MRREDCVEMFKRVPEASHPQMNLVLRNQFVLSVEVVVRFEPTYLVFRGREGGTTDEGRAFFVPYDEIGYIRLERVVRVGELKQMYGEMGFVDAEDRLSKGETQEEKAEAAKLAGDAKGPSPSVSGLPLDPASIAKQNLLDRIRATRASVSGITGRLTDKK
ncbi:hypothetical protein R5W24_005581 [Gemmata sp. JC717]|uniref:Uncharacterized protein n=1 Tax=Gemmata algarum TaxID=2975278 RepID=A0ABU5F0H0_9BACT|nr:hypothetical protein [Gemmata algarum]MDY3556416.1 hypothetical protein [Gemmata algarum]MDY3560896.1 hypothetical protein [Gemmata algarum]